MSLGGYADIFLRNIAGVRRRAADQRRSWGRARAAPSTRPAITDFIFMVKDTSLHVHHRARRHPDRDAARTSTPRTLGGAMAHATKSGVAHFAADDEDACLQRRALPPVVPAAEQPGDRAARAAVRRSARPRRRELDHVVPDSPNKPYDMRDVDPPHRRRRRVLGGARALRAQHRLRLRAARRATRSASSRNQPAQLAGCSTSTRRAKAARFVRFCDAFNIPLVTFVDVPGFLPGTAQEYGGIIRHGAKLLYAYAEATVPKITVITRKAYGGAYDVMASKHLRATSTSRGPPPRSRSWAPRARSTSSTARELGAAPTARRAPGGAHRRLPRRGSPTPTSRPSAATSTTSIDPHETRPEADHRARDAADQARGLAAAQARQHPAVAAYSWARELQREL